MNLNAGRQLPSCTALEPTSKTSDGSCVSRSSSLSAILVALR
jgi:hypothetical protein